MLYLFKINMIGGSKVNAHIFTIIYCTIINILGFVLMGIDKNRAKRNQWRIKEKTLFLIAGLGGSVGSICGMSFFRHKTKHKSFYIGMPFILIVQSCSLLYMFLL